MQDGSRYVTWGILASASLAFACGSHGSSTTASSPEAVNCHDVRFGDCLFPDIGAGCDDSGILAFEVKNIRMDGSDCVGSFRLTCADGCIASVQELPASEDAAPPVDPATLDGQWQGSTAGGQAFTWTVCNGEVLSFTASIDVSFEFGGTRTECEGETRQTTGAAVIDGVTSFPVDVPNALLEVNVEIEFASAESASGAIPAVTNTGLACLDPPAVIMSTSEQEVTQDIAFTATRSGPSDLTICDGTCVDLMSDGEHCGACDNACQTGDACLDGTCACPDGGENCDGTCVDVVSDPENCGTCGNACAGGERCLDGECECSAGLTACDGQCVSLTSDALNCGTCGNACATDRACLDGACDCPAGSLECDGTCRDVQSDAANCGGCGVVCEGTCESRDCTVVSGICPGDFVVTDNGAFWSVRCTGTCTMNSGSIMGAEFDGGVPYTLEDGLDYPVTLQTDGTNLYFAEDYSAGAIRSLPVAGGSSVAVGGATYPGGFDVVGSTIYWTNERDSEGYLEQGSVHVGDLAGSNGSTTLAVDQPGPTAVTADATNAYWVTTEGIVQQALSDGTPTLVATETGISAIAVDAERIYWTNATEGKVAAMPIGGGEITILADQQDAPERIKLDDDSAFWLNSGTAAVRGVLTAGGNDRSVASGRVRDFMLRDGRVYFAVGCSSGSTDGAVRWTPRTW